MSATSVGCEFAAELTIARPPQCRRNSSLLDRVADRESFANTGELEEAPNGAVTDYQPQIAARLLDSGTLMKQDLQAGRIHELDPAQVEDDRLADKWLQGDLDAR